MLKFIPFFQGEKRIITERLADYFDQYGLESKIHYDEAMDAYILSVPEDRVNEAKKLYQEFYFKERDRVEQEEKNKDFLKNYDEANMLAPSDGNIASGTGDDDGLSDIGADIAAASETGNDAFKESAAYSDQDDYTDRADYGEEEYADIPDETGLSGGQPDDDDSSEYADGTGQDDASGPEKEDSDEDKAALRRLLSGSGNYTFKSEKYKDYTGSFWIFLLLGIGGLIFVVLNVADVLHVLSGFFPNFVMGILFIFFIYEGISAGLKARKLKAEAAEEDQLTEKINDWLKKNVTKEFLDSVVSDETSEELDYIKKVDTIRDMLLKEFGEINTDYLDRLIDEYYSKNFD